MEQENLRGKVLKATRWASITEIAAKIVIPFTNLILARVLSPEAFGVIATITMIISFADMFTDAGFQKYLVQHEFKNDKEKYKSANVAFWTNFGVSLILWGLIGIFSNQIATLVGNSGLGLVIAIACVQLPISSFSSIQMALFRREFDFKTLFYVRLMSVSVPFVVTIPLALIGMSYWSLIIGTICGQIVNAIILNIKSKWRPQLFYDIKVLKVMLSFSIWSLIEAISIWLTIWIDAFIVGSLFNEYLLGLYKTSTTMVSAFLAVITSATTPILFSALSRLQDDQDRFNRTFFKMQRAISILVFPLGIGVYLFSDLAVKILLGNQWIDASKIIAIWALTSAIQIVLGHYCSEIYRAKGRPKLSFLAQIFHLIVLIPVCIISGKYGFWAFVYARSLIRIEAIAVHFLVLKFFVGFPVMKMINNVLPTLTSAIMMGLLGHVLQLLNDGIIWDVITIFICILFYFVLLYLLPNMKKDMMYILKIFKIKS
ncbi:lipopolysaccharide biosynthesis protein [Bacillus paranthracis]|uniref:lipopolysaccharide biosynthesis protein n=1 Tax=Bacillus paranthracis TaxID=2026186 RepID=UPI003F6CFC81